MPNWKTNFLKKYKCYHLSSLILTWYFQSWNFWSKCLKVWNLGVYNGKSVNKYTFTNTVRNCQLLKCKHLEWPFYNKTHSAFWFQSTLHPTNGKLLKWNSINNKTLVNTENAEVFLKTEERHWFPFKQVSAWNVEVSGIKIFSYFKQCNIFLCKYVSKWIWYMNSTRAF